MKTRTPLAAALLLLASSASAQLLNPGAGFGTPSQSPFSLSGASASASDDDMVFKCSTPPYIACTTAQMNRRELVRETGVCPSPVSKACTDYLKSAAGKPLSMGPIQFLGNSPDVEWASPDCTHIPCRLKDSPTGPAPTPAGQSTAGSYEDAPGFIGPPSPFRAAGNAPAMSDAQFQQAFDAAKKEHGASAIDLGNKRYGVLNEDGTIDVCGMQDCTRRPQSEFADQIQMARNESFSFNGASGGGQTNRGAPSAPGPNNSGQTNGSPNPADEVGSASDEARGSGNDAGNFFRSNSDAPGSGSGSGSDAGGSDSFASAAGKDQVIKTKAAELDGVYTYNKTQEIKATIEKTAGAVTGGVDGTFATPTNTPDANAGDLQFKGTQSGSNQ